MFWSRTPNVLVERKHVSHRTYLVQLVVLRINQSYAPDCDCGFVMACFVCEFYGATENYSVLYSGFVYL